MIKASEYNYNELLAQAEAAGDGTPEMEELADWFERYDRSDWNGEGYIVDSNRLLTPVYDCDNADDPITWTLN